MTKALEEMSSTEILYTIATAPEDAQNDFFRLLRQEGALTEEDVFNVMMAVSALRLMMNEGLKEDMGVALYNHFISQVKPDPATV